MTFNKHYSLKFVTDLEGKQFGKLTMIRFDQFKCKTPNSHKREAYWIARCVCGKEKSLRRNMVVSGLVNSCGCARGELMRQSYGKSSGELRGTSWNSIQNNAKNRNISFALTIHQAANLFTQQNRRCALSGVVLVLDAPKGQVTASLDRIDSTRGYEIGNVQWVHKVVNQMKNNMPEQEFLAWVKLIASQH